jgi:hypothetical protein
VRQEEELLEGLALLEDAVRGLVEEEEEEEEEEEATEMLKQVRKFSKVSAAL